MNNKIKKEVLNIVVVDWSSDDIEREVFVISFDVQSNVIDAKEAFYEATNEYVNEQKNKAESTDEEFSITWEEILNHIPDELFVKQGLHRRRDVVNIVEVFNSNEKPKLYEEELNMSCVDQNNNLICTDKKYNVHYWDGLDALCEEFVRELARSSIPEKQLNDDDALYISKEVLELSIKLLKENGCCFPYVDENY